MSNEFQGKIVLVAGAPCSGKGTQCKLLSKSTGMVHISAGDLCREKSLCADALGVQIKTYLDNKELVPDELFVSVLKERISQTDAQSNGVLLDGFPRTVPQVEYLQNEAQIGGMILLQSEDNSLKTRAKDRRVDPVTNDIFNLTSAPCIDAEVSKRLIQRNHDDDEAAFTNRINAWKVYFSHIEKALSDLGICKVEVDANRSISETNIMVANALAILANSVNQKNGGGGGWGEAADNGGGWGTDQSSSVSDTVSVSSPDDPIVSITPCVDININRNILIPTTVNVCVSIDVPDLLPNTNRVPCDIVCVVDISGSMNAEASVETANGNRSNTNGLTVLNLVQHSIKSVMHMIGEEDRIAIVTFNGKAERVLELTNMTDAGRETAIEALYNIRAQGRTNLWDGLHQGMEVLKGAPPPQAQTQDDVVLSDELNNLVRLNELTLEAAKTMAKFDRDQEGGGGTTSTSSNVSSSNNNRSKTILLLTDGQPNVVPPRGTLIELKDYKDTNDSFEFQINTFGFGYELESDLLLDLAEECNGTFAFIPDAVIVGTTFVDCISNVLNTKAQQAIVNLTCPTNTGISFPTNTCSFGNGKHETTETWGKQISLGPLQVNQKRTLVIPIVLPPSSSNQQHDFYLEANVTYKLLNGQNKTINCLGTQLLSSHEARLAEARAFTVNDGLIALKYALDGGPVNGQMAGQCVKNRANEIKLIVDQWINDMKNEPESQNQHQNHQPVNQPNPITFQALSTLYADVNGRMSKALDGGDRFHRWGKHYLRALIRAHQVELCTNFMDPGVQSYGLSSSTFKTIRAAGDQVFLNLPMIRPNPNAAAAAAPVQTPPAQPNNRQRRNERRNNNNNSAPAPAPTPPPPPPTDNSTYYCSGGGCIGPSNTIAVVLMDQYDMKQDDLGEYDEFERKQRLLLKDGRSSYCFQGHPVVFKLPHEIKANDYVLVMGQPTTTTNNGNYNDTDDNTNKEFFSIAQIKCVVKSKLTKEKKLLFFKPKQCSQKLKLEITSGHPIYINGKWNKPRDLWNKPDDDDDDDDMDEEYKEDKMLYNFILDKVHKLILNLDHHIKSLNDMKKKNKVSLHLSNMTNDTTTDLNLAHFQHKNVLAMVTLGHGINDDDVVSHSYLGNMKLIENDLSQLDGWEKGEVFVNQIYREISTNMIVRMC